MDKASATAGSGTLAVNAQTIVLGATPDATSDARGFAVKGFDAVTLDAGERPLLALLEFLQRKRSKQRLVRTFVRESPHPSPLPEGEGADAVAVVR